MAVPTVLCTVETDVLVFLNWQVSSPDYSLIVKLLAFGLTLDQAGITPIVMLMLFVNTWVGRKVSPSFSLFHWL